MTPFTLSVLQAVEHSPLGPFTQELVVLGTFLFSFAIWRQLQQSWKRGKVFGKPLKVSVSENCSRGDRRDQPIGTRQRQVFASTATKDEIKPAAVRKAEQEMITQLESREFTRALSTYRIMERHGTDRYFTEELYSNFTQSAIRVGKIDVVERMLLAMRRNQVDASLAFWQTTLRMLSSRKYYGASLAAYSMHNKQMPLDKVVYSCLINSALEVGRPEAALPMLDKFKKCDLDPKDHIILFRTFVALNDVDAAEATFRKLGTDVNTLMLNLLLLTCVNSGQADRAAGLVEFTHSLKSTEAVVDIVSYNTIIKGYAQAHEPKQCFATLHRMFDHGLEPDDITFGTLLDGCIIENDMGSAQEVMDLLTGSNRKLDTVMCTLFIKAFVRGGCLAKALGLYEEMKGRDASRPDIITYSVLIKALVDQHDLDHALRLLEDLTAAGHAPDDIILTHLLEGCRYAGNHALGKRLFADMMKAGVKPSDFTLVTMLKLHGRCGAHKEAYDLVASWETEYSSKPSVIHYTCLISGCLRTKHYDQAWAAYELMLANSVQPDDITLSTLVPGLVAAEQWERVLQLVKGATKTPGSAKLPTEALNNALSQMNKAGGQSQFSHHAVQLRLIMLELKVPIPSRNAQRGPS